MVRLILLSFFILIQNLILGQNQEVILIKNDPAQITLQSIDINVQIVGNIATTVTEITIYNPNDRILEGELNFPLAENQRVYRFALDIDGKLREAVAVEKNLGRRAFEGVVRQNIDPTLLEKTVGNNYKSRIYPIPANGTRKILIGVEEELQYVESPLYQLALNYKKIDNFHIKVEVVNQAFKPEIKRNDLANFDFKKWNRAFIAEQTLTDFKPNGVLSFEIPSKLTDVVYRESSIENDFFYINVNPEGKVISKKRPSTITIIWDASNSAKNRNLTKEKDLIRFYLEEFEYVEVTLIQFSDELRNETKIQVKNGESNELLNLLDTVIYDGGTNLQKVDFSSFKSDEIILFSDGITNLGGLSIKEQESPIHTVSSSNISDLSLLKYIANSTGGNFVNLVNTSIEDVLVQLNSETFQFLGATFNNKRISEVYPSQSQAINSGRSFSISGKIKRNKKASITLKFGVRGKVIETRKVQIDRLLEGSSLTRFWANKKIDELTWAPNLDRDAIITVGKKYGLVTPYTSLIVLDRVEDYVRYNITPPAELREEYDSLISKRLEESKLQDDKIIKIALDDFQSRVEWWEKEIKDSTVHIPNPDERRPNQRTESQPNNSSLGTGTQSNEEGREAANTSGVLIPIDRGEFDKVVTGRITSIEDGMALPGVNVLVKGTTRDTVSNLSGNYQIAMNNDEELVISFIGYVSEQVEVGDRSVVDFTLSSDVQELSEVVVSSYNLEAEEQSLGFSDTDITSTLRGRVAGVNISQASPGVATSISIRGSSSISLGNEPLYVVDGVPLKKSEFEALSSEEIASINLIKEENATGLYGSRAADGVIVITTKKAVENDFILPDSISSHFERDIEISDWQPEEPYLDSLIKSKPHERYKTYLQLKEIYSNTPSFYLTVGSYFISEGEESLGIRILSNLEELELENHELLKILAHKYRQIGAYEASIYLFKKISEIRDDEPHSLRDLAITYQSMGEYQLALDLFIRIITTEWHDDDERFPLFKSTVLGEMNSLIALKRKELDLSRVPKKLIKPMPLDIRVVLEWNTLETDLDLWIVEPNGEKSYYSNPLTINGGRLVRDYISGYGPEEYLLKHATKGEYSIEIDYFDDRIQKISGPTTLQVTIFTNYGRKNQKEKSFTLQLKKEEETVKVGTFSWE